MVRAERDVVAHLCQALQGGPEHSQVLGRHDALEPRNIEPAVVGHDFDVAAGGALELAHSHLEYIALLEQLVSSPRGLSSILLYIDIARIASYISLD